MNRVPFVLPLKALILAAMLTACSAETTPHTSLEIASHPPSPSIAPCPPPPDIALTLNEIVRYYTCVSSLPAPDITKEYNAASQSFSKTGRNSDRIKLAMLLSLPDTAFHSIAEALNLLETLPDEPMPPPSDLHNLARLLGMLLTEQQHEEDTLNDLAKALATEKAHSEFLQGRIDAVKDLEINLIHRDQP